ncbi:helix-turn-helix domain-containing protein [Candidatus Nitrospira bockiana]
MTLQRSPKSTFDPMSLERLRRKRGLTRQQFAEQGGMTRQNYSLLIRGKTRPMVQTLERLAAAHGVPFSYFFTRSV